MPSYILKKDFLNMISLKFIGGIFIVTGTCIGGGLLALPVTASIPGIVNSILLMISIWVVMILGSLYILEITQWFSKGKNIISISESILGKKGKIAVWLSYIILCYSLTCAYISGCGNFFYHILTIFDINISLNLTIILFTAALAIIIYRGVNSIDKWNRFFMLFQLIIFFLLIYYISPHIKTSNLLVKENKSFGVFLGVAISSFGFSIVIPSLFDYFHGNVKKVKSIIILGSIIPLICYILWMIVIIGALSNSKLQNILHSKDVTSGLITTLSTSLNTTAITQLANIFIPLCIITSVLGVTLALSDLFVDGLKLSRNKIGKIKMCCITFFPPLLIVLFFQKIFVTALSYAGLLVIIQQLILPSIIVWHGRYKKKVSKNYKVPGGKYLLSIMFTVSTGLLIICTLECINIF